MVQDSNNHELGLDMLLAECQKRGIVVEFVGDDVLHDYIGMNSEAAATMGFDWPQEIGEEPKSGWILVDKNLHDKVKYETLRHEMVELDLMRKGSPYFPAHKVALEREDELPRKMLKMKKRERMHGRRRIPLVGMLFGR